MSIEILVPTLPESVADAQLISWHKNPGDFVQQGENLVDLETDKVVLEVPAIESGILGKIAKENGATVISGELLTVIEPQQQASSSESTDTAPQQPDEISATDEAEVPTDIPLSPAVRRLIFENNLKPEAITGTGKNGRITKSDVIDFINQKSQDQQSSIPKQSETSITPVETDATIPASQIRPEQRVPMTRLRAKVAERLLQAQQNAAMLTTFNEVNMQSVIELRNQYKERFEKKHDVKLGFMSFFIKASIEALKRFPVVNASIDNNDIIYHGYYDIGIAVSTPRGLIVPVIRDADQLDFAGIEQTIVEYGQKSRDGSLSYDDLSGGTFTLTNGGIFGSMLSTPILNPPQCAILGMHAIKERPVVENKEIVIRPIMYLALSYDHRLIDGRDAVQFLATIKECLESPAHLLLNI
jgi:2-oxoglutarate dehydrogenase E2 component (dihydrolipoamide succinyltransferase)